MHLLVELSAEHLIYFFKKEVKSKFLRGFSKGYWIDEVSKRLRMGRSTGS